MKPILIILLTVGLCDYGRLDAQCLTNTSFFNAGSCSQSGTCPTWSGACTGWTRAQGTPQMMPYTIHNPKLGDIASYFAYMWGAQSGGQDVGEGIYTPFTFKAHHTYEVRIILSSFSSGGNGAVNVFAANGVSPLPGCGSPIPNLSSQQQIGLYPGLFSTPEDHTFPAFTANADYSQLWIYATGTGSAGAAQYNLDLFDVYVCPSCGGLINYNTGTAPTGESAAGTINAGSGDPNLSAVTISPTDVTTFTATTQINLVKNFTANATTGIFTAQIIPCGAITQVNSEPNPIEGGTISLPPPPISESAGIAGAETRTSQTFGGAGNANTPLQVYPTISTGGFTITGSAANVGNANILVTDESGREVYRLHNNGNTTIYLDLSKLGKGLYFLQISNGSKTTTQKIIISK